MLNISSLLLYSGRLMKTLADVQYGNHHLTTVEIVYNVISFIIAIISTIIFTVYAKTTLNNLQRAEEDGKYSASNSGTFEAENLSRERYK